jgi:hypothetical protein
VIARSTPKSQKREGDTLDLKLLQRWTPQKGTLTQYDIAATVEGKLKSAFAGGDKMGVEIPDAAANKARVLVISSSQFFANPFARAGNGPDMGQMGMQMPQMGGDENLLMFADGYARAVLTNTILVAKNLMDWVTGDTDLLAASAKILQEPSLSYGDVSKPNFDEMSEEQLSKQADEMKKERKKKQNVIGVTLMVGVPVVFALLGFLLWQRRTSRRNNALAELTGAAA